MHLAFMGGAAGLGKNSTKREPVKRLHAMKRPLNASQTTSGHNGELFGDGKHSLEEGFPCGEVDRYDD